MLKFKRINALRKSRNTNTYYAYNDLLRQTTLERVVNHNNNMTKQELIKNILAMVESQLNESIKE